MKEVWVKAIPWDREIALAAIESGADALWVPQGMEPEVKKMGVIPIVSEDGDLKLGVDVVERNIREKKDEEEILRLALSQRVIVKNGDWKIIPLENILSKTENLLIEIEDIHEGETAFGILEKGVKGVVVRGSDPQRVKSIVRKLKDKRIETVDLLSARVKRVTPLGLGERVCIDTCSFLTLGEGMLVGNSSQGLFLIHSETVENPFVNPRPFRVNAGAVHSYIRMASGETKYLSEVRAGDRVLVVNFGGKGYSSVVGRAKVERRPLILIEAEEGGERISVILQNAETIRLTQPDGKTVSVVDLREDMEVLVFRERGGRHFGVRIEETIIER